ncbi:MAG: sugar phosphate isomerase/epimerase [Gemmataceae bacterium]|nr:sugar phosphate isomerase/epimerase [Gemmataceae bacterium]
MKGTLSLAVLVSSSLAAVFAHQPPAREPAAPAPSRLTLAQKPIERTSGPRLKVSLNAYSFNKALSEGLKGQGKGMTLFDLLDFCAEHNFDAIDPTGYYFPGYPKVPDAAYLNAFKRRAFVLGLDISGTGVRTHFASPDRAKRAADVQHVKDWVEVAARLGAPVLRVFAGAAPQGHSWEEVAEWLVADLRACVAHGQKHGVLIGIQNHDDFLKTGEQVVKIVKRVDSAWFGVVVDTGAFQTPDPYRDIAAVVPYAVNWQIKEYQPGKGKVRTDLKQVVRIAREAGYRGYLPIETLPRGGEVYEPRTRVPQLLRELRTAIQSVGFESPPRQRRLTPAAGG